MYGTSLMMWNGKQEQEQENENHLELPGEQAKQSRSMTCHDASLMNPHLNPHGSRQIKYATTTKLIWIHEWHG